MLLRGKKDIRKKNWGSILFTTIVAILLLVLLFVTGSNTKVVEKKMETIFCDAEQKEGEFFVYNKKIFYGAECQSSARSYSGEYSCKLHGSCQYGLRYDLSDLKPGDRYQATVWLYRTSGDRGMLAASTEETDLFYSQTNLPVHKEESGWEMLMLTFDVPEIAPPIIKVYTYINKGSGAVFFDDLSIKKLGVKNGKADALLPNDIRLEIDEKDYKKLSDKKWEAVARGILIAEDEDWVNGTLYSPDTKMPVKLRLKGDWLDHLKKDKWSLRVKTRKLNTWNGLSTFSLQSPHTRNFLHEWVYHKFLDKEDVLSPRYDFLRLKLNQNNLGIYAFEEHFDKHLVESKNRREGPIIKLTEEGFWLGYKRQNDFYGEGTLPKRMEDAFWSSEIRPFKEQKTINSETLNDQFEIAQNLMYEYKYALKPAHEIFDIDLLAKYYAVMDLNSAYHGLAWHNQRFYYNPVTSRLEPIGFDGFGEGVAPHTEGLFLGYHADTRPERFELFRHVFRDEAFFRKYLEQLRKITSKEYLDLFILDLDQAIYYRQNLINEEYPDYRFNKENLYERARMIRHHLEAFDDISLQVRTKETQNENKILEVINAHSLPLEIIGFGVDRSSMLTNLDNPVYIPTRPAGSVPDVTEITAPLNTKFVFFKVPGGVQKTTTISTWSQPKPMVPRQAMKSTTFDQYDFIRAINDEIVIGIGNHILKEDLIIPKGKTLIIEPGANLDIIDNAALLLYSPVMAIGHEDSPIIITSSDHTAQGFTVLQTGQTSKLQHVLFDGLNTLNRNGWKLTGAVSFYEADVSMRNCSFINAVCEDGLNTIRSTIDIDGILVKGTFSDGFDADFCKGNIRNARFENTTNDAMDFSGSQIKIYNCFINNAGDKGISVGENADVFVEDVIIKNSNIGVASKDLSTLSINYIEIDNCLQGFAAYQKKPEFGPATIRVQEYKIVDVKQLYLIERGSSLKLEDKIIRGE